VARRVSVDGCVGVWPAGSIDGHERLISNGSPAIKLKLTNELVRVECRVVSRAG
jgi:hypothetical protein